MAANTAPAAGSVGADSDRDWRGPTLAVAIWIGAWMGTSGEVGWAWAAIIVGVVLAGTCWWRGRLLLAAAGLALLCAAGVGGLRAWTAAQGPVAEWARAGAVVTIEARVAGGRVSDTGPGGPVWIADATLVQVKGRGTSWNSGATVRLSASGDLLADWTGVPAGATVRAVVRLAPTNADERTSAWARVRGSPLLLTEAGWLDRAVNAVRAGLRESVAALPPAPRALVPALVVGDTDQVGEDLSADFRATGLTHLMAVSGTNLTLMLAAMLWVAARIGVNGWWRRAVAVVGVIWFVLLCRSDPSVLRAAAMGAVGLAALGWGGAGRQGLRYLSWAIVGLLLVDPWLCRSVGFVLSVCASGGIIFWAKRWADQWTAIPRWLAEAIAVPVAAQLATQPVVTAISGQVSLVGVVANLVAAPLVGPGTVLGFLAAALSIPFPPLAALAGWLAGGFAQALCWVAQVGARLPGAAMVWPAGLQASLVLVACCVVAVLGMPLVLRRRWVAAGMGLVVVAALLSPVSVPGWPPPAWQVVSCDVGQGDATVVAVGDGTAIVVDAGPDPIPTDRCLDQLGVGRVAWLVLTHLHADHVGGVAGVASGRTVERVLYSGVSQPVSGWRLLESTLPSTPKTVAVPGMVVSAGEVQLAVLAVKPYTDSGAGGEDSADHNDSSLVLRVANPRLRILLAGDVEESGQRNAQESAPDLSAEVLLVPHHGSTHQSPEFLASVGETVAIISVGAGNNYGHPAARTIASVAEVGAKVFRTDLNGSIAVAGAREQLVVTTQRDG